MTPDFVTTPLLFLQGKIFHLPTDTQTNITLLLRWFHIIAGIIWIGHLYYFNLVNVNLMKALDGPTKGKVIPQLMPRALWWFRWGAVVTVLVGLTYFAMYLLPPDANNAGKNVWVILLVWLLIVVVAFAVIFFVLRKVDKGLVVGILVGLIAALMAIAATKWLILSLRDNASSRTLSIGIGGGLGTIMLFNVWAIIWPNQKRIIAWTANSAEKGTAVPAASAKLARVAFLASRANTWLSIPMLFFMATSGTHYPLLGR